MQHYGIVYDSIFCDVLFCKDKIFLWGDYLKLYLYFSSRTPSFDGGGKTMVVYAGQQYARFHDGSQSPYGGSVIYNGKSAFLFLPVDSRGISVSDGRAGLADLSKLS